MTTEDLFKIALNGQGLLGFAAKHFVNADQEIKKEFLLNLKEQIPLTRKDMVGYYGEEFVTELEKYQ